MQLSLAIIGLGKMGANMARRLARGGAQVVAYDADSAAAAELAAEPRVSRVLSLRAAVEALASPRVVWLMVPAGSPTEALIAELVPLLDEGDLLVDGGNANYKDSQRRARQLAARGLQFLDCGVSGGVWGLQNGYALMFGGEPAAAARLTPFVKLLAPSAEQGWLHCGPAGAGHFVKMIHNGIEYGMMQALAEGLALLRGQPQLDLDVAAVAELWRHGSVVRSWLLDLTAAFLQQDQQLEEVAPLVADSGEGRWTVQEAVEQGTPAPVIALALMERWASQGRGDYAAKLLAMMRRGFGGHGVTPAGSAP